VARFAAKGAAAILVALGVALVTRKRMRRKDGYRFPEKIIEAIALQGASASRLAFAFDAELVDGFAEIVGEKRNAEQIGGSAPVVGARRLCPQPPGRNRPGRMPPKRTRIAPRTSVAGSSRFYQLRSCAWAGHSAVAPQVFP